MKRPTLLASLWERRPEGRFISLVILQVLFIMFSPFLATRGHFGQILLVLQGTLVPLAGSFAFAQRLRQYRMLLSLALPYIAISWLDTFLVPPVVPYLRIVLGILFYLVVILVLLEFVLRQRKVTFDLIFGGISVYLLLGGLWVLIFQLIETFAPGSFSSSFPIDFTYYSYTALTSTGFGDIVPVSPFARSFTSLESISGVLFIAVLIGRMVGMHASGRNNDFPGKQVDGSTPPDEQDSSPSP